MSLFDSSMQFIERNFEHAYRNRSVQDNKRKLLEVLMNYLHQKKQTSKKKVSVDTTQFNSSLDNIVKSEIIAESSSPRPYNSF